MILNGKDFGRIFWCAGAENVFGPGRGPGHGWWYDPFLRILFAAPLDYPTFIAKTTPTFEKEGCMPLNKRTLQPKEWIPSCVRLYFFKGVALNCVSLSSTGAADQFARKEWEKIKKPFFLSHMCVFKTQEEKIHELKVFGYLLKDRLPYFQAPVAWEENYLCPNLQGHEKAEWNDSVEIKKLEQWVLRSLEVISEMNLDIPIIVKLNDLVPVETMVNIVRFGQCHALSLSNTIIFGAMPDKIPWKKLFGTDDPEKSPLAKFNTGGGGLSGWPLVDPTCERIAEFRKYESNFPVIGGGGLNCRWLWRDTKNDIDKYVNAGATALAFGTGKLLRPWNLGRSFRYADKKLKEAGR